ncbi:MBL fold metallo-hydrolase [Thalassovita taeanensis]|uniref:Glyoxylase, beta-lactamase superfamily II n=1 Tax=Thalassovita taeanensis TaxID=657014 RepID=A0A1H9HCY7_9RHOB|nr:MBL fold metallo-hydrolase [Thalassovita taeanensis]SEQ60203.1 Glyoxylase, beta-lactamase superfamily II [Thalassovita taeanensis]
MAEWQYTKGLHDIGNGCWAWLQPNGGWGWSNAGLITDGEASMLVDTLFDLKLTGDMLDGMRQSVPQAASIGILVNTHANGDHTYGNQLVKDARIIASQGTANEFDHVPPTVFHDMVLNPGPFGRAGEFVAECFCPFDFANIVLTPPTEVFTGETTVMVGDKTVQLIEVGPAHTAGDTLVYLPEDKVVYTGDILFNEGTPIAWAGPVSNWIRACERILELDVDVVVPGHGPIADKQDVATMRDYLVYVSAETRTRYDAGMDFLAAAYDIDLGDYADWDAPERLIVTVQTLYDTFPDAPTPERAPIPYFELMKDFRVKHGWGTVHGAPCPCGRVH